MNDVERRLAEWLHREAPEPPRAVSATRIMDRELEVRTVARPRRRVWPPLLAATAVAAAIVAVILAVTSAGQDSRPRPAVSPTTTPPTPTTTSPPSADLGAPPPDFAATRLLGTTGRYAWKLTNTLRVTADGGAHWTRIPLPAGVRPGAVDTAQVGDDGTVVLADAHRNQTVDLYRRPAGVTSWKLTTLSTTPPGPGYPPPYAQPMQADGNFLTVVTGWGTSPARSVDDVWISTDGGATFSQRRTGLDSGVHDLLFLDADRGLLLSQHETLYRTTDGGRHWTKLGGSLAGRHDVEFGALYRDGADVLVPRLTYTAHRIDVALYRSSDAGATFRRPASPLQVRDAGSDPLYLGVSGRIVWVAAGRTIFRSDDGGATWSRVASDTDVHRAIPTGPSTAVGVSAADCSSNDPKERCWQTDYLVATTDGGRTWHSL